MTYRPMVLLHPEEQYFPCTFDEYLSHCVLRSRDTGQIVEAKVDAEILSRYKTSSDRVFTLDCEASFWTQRPPSLASIPIYAKVQVGAEQIQLQYWFVFPYNGPSFFSMGAHQSDWEHFSLILNRQDLTVQKAYFSAHGSNDGIWCDSVKMMEQTRPIVLCAKFTHACYPPNFAPCVPRLGCFANDWVTLNDAMVWNPDQIVLIDDYIPVWQQFTGTIGWPDHGEVPARKDSWVNEPASSATFFSRLFPCLS